MRDIDKIIIHCSFTPPKMDIGVKEIRKWHIEERGWSDIGYHYVIRRDGTIEEGRDVSINGAHTKGYNYHSIGICMVGGKGVNGGDEPNFNWEQYASMVDLVRDLVNEYGTDVTIHGHNEFNKNKTCPTFFLNK